MLIKKVKFTLITLAGKTQRLVGMGRTHSSVEIIFI